MEVDMEGQTPAEIEKKYTAAYQKFYANILDHEV